MTSTHDGLTAQEWAAKYRNLVAESAAVRLAEIESGIHREKRERESWRDEWRTVKAKSGTENRPEWMHKTYGSAAEEVSECPWLDVQHRRVTDWQAVSTAPHNNI